MGFPRANKASHRILLSQGQVSGCFDMFTKTRGPTGHPATKAAKLPDYLCRSISERCYVFFSHHALQLAGSPRSFFCRLDWFESCHFSIENSLLVRTRPPSKNYFLTTTSLYTCPSANIRGQRHLESNSKTYFVNAQRMRLASLMSKNDGFNGLIKLKIHPSGCVPCECRVGRNVSQA